MLCPPGGGFVSVEDQDGLSFASLRICSLASPEVDQLTLDGSVVELELRCLPCGLVPDAG